jgi:hypothetical protein
MGTMFRILLSKAEIAVIHDLFPNQIIQPGIVINQCLSFQGVDKFPEKRICDVLGTERVERALAWVFVLK